MIIIPFYGWGNWGTGKYPAQGHVVIKRWSQDFSLQSMTGESKLNHYTFLLSTHSMGLY